MLVVWTTQLLIALLGMLVLLDVRWWCWITVSGSTWPIRLTALFMISVGLLFTIAAMFQVQRASAAKTWPTTEGRVLSSQIKASQTIGFYSPSATVCLFEVRYEYPVGGSTHRSDRFAFGAKGFTRREEAEEIAARYPVGQAVQVRYDPKNPGLGVLEPRVNKPSFTKAMAAVGVFAVIAGIFFLLVSVE